MNSYQHEGEEAGLVISGLLELMIDDNVYILEEGDSFSFDSNLNHRFSNASITEDTIVVWANSPISLRY